MARKTGIFGGFIALLLAFVYEIPLYPPENWALNLRIFRLDNIDYYFWGYVYRNQAHTSITARPWENLVALSLWIIILLIGLILIMASTTKAKPTNSLKLCKVSIVLVILLLFIYTSIIVLTGLSTIGQLFLNVLGLGYYLMILILILNIIALKKISKEN